MMAVCVFTMIVVCVFSDSCVFAVTAVCVFSVSFCVFGKTICWCVSSVKCLRVYSDKWLCVYFEKGFVCLH